MIELINVHNFCSICLAKHRFVKKILKIECQKPQKMARIFSGPGELIIANHGFESASFLSNPWFKDATFESTGDERGNRWKSPVGYWRWDELLGKTTQVKSKDRWIIYNDGSISCLRVRGIPTKAKWLYNFLSVK